MAVWRGDGYRTRELSTKVECKNVGIVTLASEGGDKEGASPQIVSTVACRKDARLDPQKAVSEEGLPCIEDVDD